MSFSNTSLFVDFDLNVSVPDDDDPTIFVRDYIRDMGVEPVAIRLTRTRGGYPEFRVRVHDEDIHLVAMFFQYTMSEFSVRHNTRWSDN